MPYYAQINSDRVVYSVTETSGVIDAPDMVEISELDTSLLGKVHDQETGEFRDA